MNLTLTEDQEHAFKAVREGSSIAVITGYAGTGKTTMIRVIFEHFDDGEGQKDGYRSIKQNAVTVLAPTGKAALRVSEATGVRARTIHSWLYSPVEDPETGQIRYARKEPKLFNERRGAVVIIDEGSMVARKQWEDILVVASELSLRIVILGDPFQLPPVQPSDEEPFNLLDVKTPHRSHMTQIVRQALDNPIIRASMHIREGKVQSGLKLLTYVNPFEFPEMAKQTYLDGGVVISHTNAQRHANNVMLRCAMGHGPDNPLAAGEPLLVTRNNYDIEYFNGEIVRFDKWFREATLRERVMATDRSTKKDFPVLYGHGQVEGRHVILAPDGIFGRLTGASVESAITRASGLYYTSYIDKGLCPNPPPLLHANLGYSLTCHKSQGSEWKYVLIQPSKWMRFKTEEDRRWLYTAITRAKEEARYTDG